ncbi:unnamed protein product [Didymodactylos carnosus]|uniref:Uncharacterized protein n=1 Tax=Didymodactylos carnosus TaxID=1234261 RepID=A0A816AQ46_9BILA|nr:unnamed protein product [Didymodactylos carnosus]CAF4474846.1 unnamed protein product [Didymodactylos carnosus]
MDWLTYYDVHILPGDQQLKLHHRRWLTIASFDTDTPIDARVDKEYQILPGSECVITLKITMAPAQNLYFQAINGQLQNQRRITLQDGLVTVDNSTLKVQVLNSSKSSVTLQKNVKLGTLSHLSFDTYCSTMTQVTEVGANGPRISTVSDENLVNKSIASLVAHITDQQQHQLVEWLVVTKW